MEEETWYKQQLQNDDDGNWSCFADVANGSNIEYMRDLMDGNWSMAIDERSEQEVLIPTNRAVGKKDVYYKPGSTVTITIQGTQQFIDKVKEVIVNFAQPHVNLKFEFIASGGSIVIDNNYTGGGVTRCLGCQNPSISISSASQGLVLHELGHALGMHHEMKNPNIKLTWIESILVQMYKTAEFVKSQITSTVNPNTVNATQFDKNSIMIYNLPGKTNKENIDMKPSSTYTDLDKQWLIMTYGQIPGTTSTLPLTTTSTTTPTTSTTSTTTTTTTLTTPSVKKTIVKRPRATPRSRADDLESDYRYDLLPPIVGKNDNVIVTQPSWLDNIILFVLSFFS